MTEFEKNSSGSEQLKAAVYYELKRQGHSLQGGYVSATKEQDKFQKHDVYYNLDGVSRVPFQLRAYGAAFYKNGFPVRDASLVNLNELQLLEAGELDDAYFVFALSRWEESKQKYNFLKMKMVLGKYLHRDITNVIGERVFPEGNRVVYIADPSETEYLRV